MSLFKRTPKEAPQRAGKELPLGWEEIRTSTFEVRFRDSPEAIDDLIAMLHIARNQAQAFENEDHDLEMIR